MRTFSCLWLGIALFVPCLRAQQLPPQPVPTQNPVTPPLFGQWFVWDGGVPAGLATSRGGEVRLF